MRRTEESSHYRREKSIVPVVTRALGRITQRKHISIYDEAACETRYAERKGDRDRELHNQVPICYNNPGNHMETNRINGPVTIADETLCSVIMACWR